MNTPSTALNLDLMYWFNYYIEQLVFHVPAVLGLGLADCTLPLFPVPSLVCERTC